MRTLQPGHEVIAIDQYASVRREPAPDRSWVLANMVGGLDGSAAVGGRVGALSDDADAELFRAMRSVADVVLVGAQTVRAERYGPARAVATTGRPDAPPIAVVSASLQIDWTLPVFTEAAAARRTIVITSEAADRRAIADAERVATVLTAGADVVDLPLALERLRGLGHRVVLCEGGPMLLGTLVADDLLDEMCLTLAPVMGGDPLPVAVTPDRGGLRRFALRHVLCDDDTLFLRYERQR